MYFFSKEEIYYCWTLTYSVCHGRNAYEKGERVILASFWDNEESLKPYKPETFEEFSQRLTICNGDLCYATKIIPEGHNQYQYRNYDPSIII